MTLSADNPATPSRPRATYRLQLNKDFRFEDARRIVPYLAVLGISHVYLSPILMARPGSTHGYDIVDHNRLNPEIGDARDFDAFVDTLHRHGMGVILDFVPNHMYVGPDNSWWMDILEWGKSSPFASYVDIDWEPLEPTNMGKVLLPVLGDHYGAVLERGELQLCFEQSQGMFVIRYFDNVYPISPRDYPVLLQRAASASAEVAQHLTSVISDFSNCLRMRGSRVRRMARHEGVKALKARLARLAAEDEDVARALGGVVASFQGDVARPGTFDALHRLLERQFYRLAFWRVAAHEINYRRFFDVNELAGLRMEQPELFEISHRLIGNLIATGKIQGLRLDHIDGLRSPKEYLSRVQALAAGDSYGRSPRRAGRPLRSFYVAVEKILASHERLRADWPVSGTTGYDFMAEVNGLFIDPSAESGITRAYWRFIGRDVDYREIVDESKRHIMRQTLASELNVLANAFNRLAKRSRRTRDYTTTGFRDALEDVIACFPVYRTYATVEGIAQEDRRIIGEAVDAAYRTTRTADTSIYDFIRAVLTLELTETGKGTYPRHAVIDTALKFQQYTGPVMAKAVEDTAFYRYVRFVSLNEVGSEPNRFGISPDSFHESARERLSRFPSSMISTATHDHKRGEDVRARLNVLSEIPAEWARRVRRWARLNVRLRRGVEGRRAPNPSDEYLFYQTIVGAWPFELSPPDFAGLERVRERVRAYMLKAARESKVRTSWAAPHVEYEKALDAFVEATLDPDKSRPFLEDVAAFTHDIAPAGAINGLAQTVLKLTAPGVPDIYQGTELWDLSLVDPDNRRPVDYGARRMLLENSPVRALDRLRKEWRTGAIKQYLIHRILELRCRRPQLFGLGAYLPVRATGPAARHIVAFARRHADEVLVTIVPRFVKQKFSDDETLRTCGWKDTSVVLEALTGNAGLYNLLSGEDVDVAGDGLLAVGEVFSKFPVAVLCHLAEGRT